MIASALKSFTCRTYFDGHHVVWSAYKLANMVDQKREGSCLAAKKHNALSQKQPKGVTSHVLCPARK